MITITENFDLKPFNTFALPSVAERLAQVNSKFDLAEYFESSNPQPSLVLGGGSNLLLTQNISGTVLKIEIPGINMLEETDEHVRVSVGAGVVWHQFVLHCIANGWAGVENLSLIPGNVGAAPMQNIGAYGVEVESVFEQLEAYLTLDKSWETFKKDECNFGYRESIFKRGLKNKAVIANVTFKLSKKPKLNTSYGAIEAELERMGMENVSIKAISDAVIAIRQSKLPDPKKIGNSGSFFKNPVIDNEQFSRLKLEYPGMVGYDVGHGQTKVAAGWLIETAGYKGTRRGSCGVHDRQALVLVNYGGATGAQVFALSQEIMDGIKDKFGIELEREVNVV